MDTQTIDIAVGDKVQVLYIHDNHKDNGRTGIVSWAHISKFYPNGDYSEVTHKAQIKITFENGETLETNYNPKSIKKL